MAACAWTGAWRSPASRFRANDSRLWTLVEGASGFTGELSGELGDGELVLRFQSPAAEAGA